MPKKWDGKELSQSQSSRRKGMNHLSLRWFYTKKCSPGNNDHYFTYYLIILTFFQVHWIIWEKLQFVYLKHSFQIYALWWEWTPHRRESDKWEIHKPIWLGPRWFCIWWRNIFIITAVPQIILWMQSVLQKQKLKIIWISMQTQSTTMWIKTGSMWSQTTTFQTRNFKKILANLRYTSCHPVIVINWTRIQWCQKDLW